ncbi:hypothetical protein EAH81_26300 [Flavobacterium pectinovorum]|uniref:Uncharacterized protein n=1 Tax=Flavobacterium pectinovorum TaxID=29533 RepID=A0A502E5R1_9FLAO|nr:hypothetical protein EAH81_26300 [Flavobacterium pectinovorum]
MRILDKEKAEILGSVLTSGFGATGVSTFEVSTVSAFCEVSVTDEAVVFSTEVGLTVSTLSTFDFGL